jgi:phosphatidylethanolamine/phosphatidyl-N-methylethanolamine N-methyltransferase
MKNLRDEPVLAGQGTIKQADVYSSLNYGPGLAGRLLKLSHQVCEREFGSQDHFGSVLEVGTGSGHHIHSVRHRFDRYVMSDLNPDYLRHLASSLAPEFPGRTEVDAQDATRLTYADDTFDRVIATHVLEHLPEPQSVLREWARVLKPGGVLSLVLPCDPGIAWRVGRNFGPRKAAEKQGIPYDYVMAREHINSIGNLITLVRHTFPKRKEVWSPLPVPIYDANLFYICHAWV